MRRRDFVKTALAGAVLPALGSGLLPRPAAALPLSGRIVVNVMLPGGADLRHLFVPDPARQRDYAASFWRARTELYELWSSELADYQKILTGNYLLSDIDGQSFGIHKSADWLKRMYDSGRVAIIANVVGTSSRAHDAAQLAWHTGNINASPFQDERDGWGGRLAYAIGNANVVNPVPQVSPFGYGTDPKNRNTKVFRAYRVRNGMLQESDPNIDRNTVARALKGYYDGKQPEVTGSRWPYSVILEHERKLRSLGQAINQRLAQTAQARPAALANLYSYSSTSLANKTFGEQCADFYDCLLAADLIKMRIAYLELGGWDTHGNQSLSMPSLFSDLFGTGKGLATLYGLIEPAGAADDIVFVLSSDFGRQLAVNSRRGTDHGSASYTIVIGNSVRGGVYGEMFPGSEIQGSAGETAFEQPGADILGRTSSVQVLGAISEWVQPGAGAKVFPNYKMAMLEPGVDLQRLFG